MKKAELLKEWHDKKQDYATQEIGSGTQSFVRKVLESPEVFGLKEGAFQTEKYNSDYIAEASKERNRADFIIRIDEDIQIPIEVEKYGNIQVGIQQIARYQAVWDKKYGILTDGYEWRFYIGSRYRTLTLDEILSGDTLFQTFWKDYVRQDNYYLIYFDHEERGELFKAEPQAIGGDQQVGIFFDNTTTLIRKFRGKLKLEQYFIQAKDNKEREKNATEITYAYIIQFILYKVLVDNDFKEFGNTYKDIREAITEALRKPSGISYNGILNLITRMAEKISADIYRPFADEQKFIGEKLSAILGSPKNEISDIAPWLDMFIFIDSFTFANIQNEIFGHVYENYLKDLYAEENRGQYFTHPAVVDFMLKEIGYTPETVKVKGYQDISIIDPSCGSGTFLYKITDILVDSFGNDIAGAKKQLSALVHENVFGLDIEEFPLYLAEMSILMRMLPYIVGEKHNNAMDKKIKVFKTKDSVAEFLGETQESDTLFTTDIDLGYHSFMRDEQNLADLKESLKGQNWKDAQNGTHAPRRRFDFVIGNPPYIGANECYKQGVLTYQLIKDRKVSLGNIYGINLHSVKGNNKKSSPKINLWAMFIALGQSLLKENGRISYIIPQGLLTRPSYDVLRHYLSQNMVIEKIFIFANKLFTERGIRTKKDVVTSSLIFVVRKRAEGETQESLQDNMVQLIRYNGAETDPIICMEDMKTRRNCTVFPIKQEVLQKELRSWNHFFKGKEFLALLDKYTQNSESMGIYYDHKLAQARFKTSFWFDIGYDFPHEKILLDKPIQNSFKMTTIGQSQKGYLLRDHIGYIPSDFTQIKLLQANQGFNLLESPYKILWAIKRPDRFVFTDEKFITRGLAVGGIGSKNKDELLYLLILMNAAISWKILEGLHKPYNEDKFKLLLPPVEIKQFLRVPIITPQNQPLKDRLITIAQAILDAEKPLFKDCIDFGAYMQQSIDTLRLEGGKLIINSSGKDTALAPKAGISPARIEPNLALYLKEHKKDMSLLTLKSFPCIDNEAIARLMVEANDIVYQLYGLDDQDRKIVEGGETYIPPGR